MDIRYEGAGIVLSCDEFLQLAACVFEHVDLGVLITDPAGTILSVNRAFVRMTGYEREEALGKSPAFLQSGRQGAQFYRDMWKALRERGNWSGVIWNRRKDGAHYAELLTISSIRQADGSISHYIGSFSDITQMKSHEANLERLAYFDSLTELPNRVLLADRLEQAILRARRSGQRLAVCVLDLDGFKPVNDRCGHAVGDEVLIAAAARLSASVRDSDTVSRVGGDEFVVLLEGGECEDDFAGTLQRMTAALLEPIEVAAGVFQLGVSVGVAFYPDTATNGRELLECADQAMYEAKRAGGARFHWFGRAPA